MILTDEEMRQLRRSIEEHAGLEPELLQRCGHLVHIGAYDEAVRSAFVLLEEELRKAANVDGMTGTQLANHAFSPKNGPLAKHLGPNESEREGFRELYSGAFKIFRNQAAHGLVGYDANKGKAILGLVNLLLIMLKEIPVVDHGEFPENVENALKEVEEAIGTAGARRLRAFIGKCLKLGLKTTSKATQWLPFRQQGLAAFEGRDKSKSHAITVFYLVGPQHALWVPAHQYFDHVVGFDVKRLVNQLSELGFTPHGRHQEPRIDLKFHNDQAFFDAFFGIVKWASEELLESLKRREGHEPKKG